MIEPIIDKEFQSLIQPPTTEEYSQLEENLINDGCRDPLVLWGDILIDGHNRLKICKAHDIPYKTVVQKFDSRDDVKIWIIKNQLGRRNLPTFWSSELALTLKPMIAAKAKENQKLSEGRGKKGLEKSTNLKAQFNTREELAQLAGVSSNTIRRVEYIKENGTPEQIERARKGGKGNSVNAVYRDVKTAELENAGITAITCEHCQTEKPLSEFREDRKICKICETEVQKERRRIKPHSTDTLDVPQTTEYKEPAPQPKKKTPPSNLDSINESIARAYDDTNEIDYTIDDLCEELGAAVKNFCSITADCIHKHMNLLKTAEDKQKIIAVLLEAETAINQIKGASLYD